MIWRLIGSVTTGSPVRNNTRANFFRLYLHASALNLLVRLRNELPEPPEKRVRARVFGPNESIPMSVPDDGSSLRRATPTTWRMRLIKVAAEVRVSA